MERNSRGHENDYQQFSNFLRGRRSDATTPCNSSPSPVAPKPNCQNNSYTTRPVAMVYPVMQEWKSIYDPEIALINGTIFEELNKPFYMSGCSQNGGCRGKGGAQW
ncbi:MAG: spore coat associated protein CotJA [Clostridia bacterium]|nr:spore coat associated protein CotJA [Clostridia bacterium]MBQ8739886.1 spore coat associated protein CotJA [Clostridia bacterium]